MRLTGDRNQCQGCKQFFNSTFAFDKHRAGEHGRNRCCLPVAEMEAKGMEKNAAGFWVGSRMPDGIAHSVPMGEDEEAYMLASMPRWGRA
jgi:hypothetical protein